MEDERKYYVLCGDNCKFEGMTKEQILTAVEQAISTGEIKDVNSGFITTIKEQNRNDGLKFWVGTTAQYNAIAEKQDDTLYLLTDETILTDIEKLCEETNVICKEVSQQSTTALEIVENCQTQLDKRNKILVKPNADISENYIYYDAGKYPFGEYRGFAFTMSKTKTSAQLTQDNTKTFFAYTFIDYNGALCCEGALHFENATLRIKFKFVFNSDGKDYIFTQFAVFGTNETEIAEAKKYKYLRQIIGVI